jgi:hypothetical protein
LRQRRLSAGVDFGFPDIEQVFPAVGAIDRPGERQGRDAPYVTVAVEPTGLFCQPDTSGDASGDASGTNMALNLATSGVGHYRRHARSA